MKSLREHSIEFHSVRGKVRSVYLQVDGKFILADECACAIIFLGFEPWLNTNISFRVERSIACPVDQHRIAALRAA